MVDACGDSVANPCILLKSLLTIALERFGFSTHTHTHTHILHCPDELESLHNLVEMCFMCFLDRSFSSSNRLVRVIFWEASHLCYNFTGFNIIHGDTSVKQYSDQDWLCADVIHHFQCRPRSVQFFRTERVQISEMLCTIATASTFSKYLLTFHCFASYFLCTFNVVFTKKQT